MKRRLNAFLFVIFFSGVILVGCQATPQTQMLISKNESLQAQLSEANNRISELEIEGSRKQDDIEELNRVLGVLDTEKSSRVQESSVLRGQVRKFVQEQIDSLKKFLVLGDLLDYVGGELVEREFVEERSLLLVDLAHPVPRNGTLTGVGAFMNKATPFQVKVLRPVGDDLVVIWESGMVSVAEAGKIRAEFPVSVGLEKGDFLGYYFPESVGVSFDEGTSDTRYLSRNLRLGGNIKKASLSGVAKKRAYSIGVFGLLN
ncbi:MAG: hypothetical protein K6L75_08225 [Cellvibrionaceae bacterium]